jgi:hypothetical protein
MGKTEAPEDDFELDARRQAVFEALRSLSLEAAGYYKAAIAVLSLPAREGEHRAKVSTICHAFREIVNSLPSMLGETASAPIVPSSGLLLRDLPDFRFDLAGDDPIVAVPREIATQLDDVLRTVALESARQEADLASLFAGMKQEAHPLVAPWRRAQRFFLHWAHWDRPADENRPLPSDVELDEHVVIVEDIIVARVAPFFDARRSIEDVIAEANRLDEEGPE